MIYSTCIKYFWFSWYFIEETNVWFVFDPTSSIQAEQGTPQNFLSVTSLSVKFLLAPGKTSEKSNTICKMLTDRGLNDFRNRFLFSDWECLVLVNNLSTGRYNFYHNVTQMDWVTNLNFLIPISLQPNVVKQWILLDYLIQVWNKKFEFVAKTQFFI